VQGGAREELANLGHEQKKPTWQAVDVTLLASAASRRGRTLLFEKAWESSVSPTEERKKRTTRSAAVDGSLRSPGGTSTEPAGKNTLFSRIGGESFGPRC